LSFAYVLGRSGGDGILVLENCLVNNVTNLTLLIGLPAAIWALDLFPNRNGGGKGGGAVTRKNRLNYLSLLLTIIAVFFFTGTVWALSRDGLIESGDGLVLVGMFIFWQLFHIFDVLKQNVHQRRDLHYSLIVEVIVVIAAGWLVYGAIDRLVTWIPHHGSGIIVFKNLGWLSGMLMVMPNAFSAMYYGYTRRADIVFSSQTGDGHICIPMCVGLFALFKPIETPHFLNLGVLTIFGAAAVHFFFIATVGKLPRPFGLLLILVYGFFVYHAVLQ
jgi:cation:H+ antiporter